MVGRPRLPAPNLYISEVERDNKHGQMAKNRQNKITRGGAVVNGGKSPFIIFEAGNYYW